MPVFLKWSILVIPSLAALGMLWLWLIRNVQDSDEKKPGGLSDDHFRFLAYFVSLLLCLAVAIFELSSISAPKP